MDTKPRKLQNRKITITNYNYNFLRVFRGFVISRFCNIRGFVFRGFVSTPYIPNHVIKDKNNQKFQTPQGYDIDLNSITKYVVLY